MFNLCPLRMVAISCPQVKCVHCSSFAPAPTTIGRGGPAAARSRTPGRGVPGDHQLLLARLLLQIARLPHAARSELNEVNAPVLDRCGPTALPTMPRMPPNARTTRSGPYPRLPVPAHPHQQASRDDRPPAKLGQTHQLRQVRHRPAELHQEAFSTAHGETEARLICQSRCRGGGVRSADSASPRLLLGQMSLRWM